MARLSSPPGDYCRTAAQIVAGLSDAGLAVESPHVELASPVLTIADGVEIRSPHAILKFLCGGGELYPEMDSLAAGQIDQWLDVAASIDKGARNWVEPYCEASGVDAGSRRKAKSLVLGHLEALERHLGDRTFLVADGMSLADVAVAASLLPLMAETMGVEDRAPFGSVMRWFGTCTGYPQVERSIGTVALCAKHRGWEAGCGGKEGKKKKKGGGESAEKAVVENGGEEDPARKARKEAKAREKELKKQKAKEKAQKAEAQKGQAPSSKAAALKAEAEAKRRAEAEEVERLTSEARATPKGEKKDVSKEMPKAYHPMVVEAAWYDWWEASGFFKPDEGGDRPPFVIVIPPPNVTGALHIGHALTHAIEDTIVRWRRMSGDNVLWVPGTDHAGIATQTVVEKMLQREHKVTRHDIGREKFLEHVWGWVEKYGNRIKDQMRRIGDSVDWSRERFTMDRTLSRAVMESFTRMYDEGLIYRDNRLVNWCCKLRTALSDIEVDYIDIPKRTLLPVPGYADPVEFGVLVSFAYPLADGDGEVVVATTRIETMLGDTAVAVHPDDPRYKALHGKFVVHPIGDRKIPIITDGELVDMEFGTGAVKITPAHDPNDYASGKRHDLEFINIFDDNGLVNENGGPFQGQPRFKARLTVQEMLREKGLHRGTQDNPMRLGLCSRSKDVIEPALKPQWWVNCKDMGAAACRAVEDGTLELVPNDFESTWYHWLRNIRDWCISRQLWWGHRIPAYYVTLDGEDPSTAGVPGFSSEKAERWVIGKTREEAEERARAKFPGRTFSLEQDEDVLDTWFSSGLFPFSVFGWPAESQSLAKFYPNALLETGHDILFFWVARMVMMGMKLTGKVPFKRVYLHSMVRDAHGRKMSKSLGNVIDPIHVIEGISLEELHQTLMGGNLDAKEIARAKDGQAMNFPDGIAECGTDALRFALVAYTSQARDINLDIKRVVAYRHWCNKLWNAIKFAMINLPEDFTPATTLDVKTFPMASRWILSRLSCTIKSAVAKLEAYDFGPSTQVIYSFWQNDVCDVFIELMKPVMALDEAMAENCERKRATREALWLCLDTGLRLLHPFMPFVTEELWQRLPRREDQKSTPSIMVAPYPVAEDAWVDQELESNMAYIDSVVTRTRQMRSDYGLTNKQKPTLYIACSDAKMSGVLSSAACDIQTLSYSSAVNVVGEGAPLPKGCSAAVLDATTSLHIELTGILDPSKELARLRKKMGEAEAAKEQLNKKMLMPSYAEKTPESVKNENVEKLAKKESEIDSIRKCISTMEEMVEGAS